MHEKAILLWESLFSCPIAVVINGVTIFIAKFQSVNLDLTPDFKNYKRMENINRQELAFEKFDAYNQKDPNSILWDGISYPREYFLSLKLHEWVVKIDPAAGEALLLASRSQHIGRWEIPRDSYPLGRESYLKWRRDLAHHHAQIAAEILKESGYHEEEIDRVQQIILKKKIKQDSDVQTMENALCLVFLAYQYEAFHPLHDAEKVVNILRKSLLKMDEVGHQFALTLNYSEEGLAHVRSALSLI
ncbi:DUF4202 domain-containing protein [Pedobacter sp.]|uniref:DUF4202 domain-containing protein n=1 Tax=Pedobacter sp. TaxID=1411316 RepID=UPI003D7F3B50